MCQSMEEKVPFPPQKGEEGEALAKGGKRRGRGGEGQNNKQEIEKEGGQVK